MSVSNQSYSRYMHFSEKDCQKSWAPWWLVWQSEKYNHKLEIPPQAQQNPIWNTSYKWKVKNGGKVHF
jgi:hypothetical protein